MKIRTGFVSNSSSSSFCIIGVDDDGIVQELCKAEGLIFGDDDYEENENVRNCMCDVGSAILGMNVEFCPMCGKKFWVSNDKPSKPKPNAELAYGVVEGKHLRFCGNDVTPSYAGVDADKLLEKMSIAKARKHFVKMCKDVLKVEVPEKMVQLLYGEVGNGG